MILAPAVKWAEMAANHENDWNWKKKISLAHDHYVGSWLHTSEILTEHLHSSLDLLCETAEKRLFLC